MKKLFSIGVLTLVMLMSCQNGSDEIMSQSVNMTGLSVNRHGVVLSKIEYIHQLQNLYFSLTGEELTVKH